MRARTIIASAIRGLPKVPPRNVRRARAALVWTRADVADPKRMRAMQALGEMRGYRLAHGARLTLKISGHIGQPGGVAKNEINPIEIEMRLGANPHIEFIDLIIDSMGGSVRGAQRIHNALRAHPGYVVAMVDGQCASAAIQILLAADWREAMIDSSIMLHAVEIAPSALSAKRRFTAERHRELARICDETDRFLIDQCAARTGQPRRIFEREFSNESGMSPQRAISCGLLHAMVGQTQWMRGQPYVWPPGCYD